MIEMGRRHVDGVAVMQDLSSLIGLVAVLALVAYGLRRGREPAVPNRLVPRTERRQWLLAYVLAVVALSCAFYVRARWAQPPLHSTFAQISTMAVAALRGLAAALLGVSLALDLRLRALRYRSSGPDR